MQMALHTHTHAHCFARTEMSNDWIAFIFAFSNKKPNICGIFVEKEFFKIKMKDLKNIFQHNSIVKKTYVEPKVEFPMKT